MKGRFRIGEKGAAAVEFAIILPLLVLIVFGTMEFALLMFNKQVITNAAREGARKAIIFQETQVSDAEITSVVNDYCKEQLITFGDSSTALETPVIERTTNSDGDSIVSVKVYYTYDFLVLSNLGFDPVRIDSVSVMRMEQN
jgi:Flp pilus assembly protein TadG